MSVEAVRCDDPKSPVIYVRGVADMAVYLVKANENNYVVVAEGKTKNDVENGRNGEGQLLLALMAEGNCAGMLQQVCFFVSTVGWVRRKTGDKWLKALEAH